MRVSDGNLSDTITVNVTITAVVGTCSAGSRSFDQDCC